MNPIIEPLLELSRKHQFMIFEDRKFADIGNTVKKQYIGGVYKISSWADITNAHGVTGNGVVEGLKQGAKETTTNQEPRGLLMLAELSSVGSLAYGEYSQKLLKLLNPIRNLLLDLLPNVIWVDKKKDLIGLL